MQRVTDRIGGFHIVFVILLFFLSCSKVDKGSQQVRKMANAFQERRKESFMSSFQYIRVIKSKSRCIHFQAFSGFSEVSGKTNATFYTSDALISVLRNPENGNNVDPWIVHPSSKRSDIKSYYAGYNNFVRPQLWDWISLIEKESPLNPQKRSLYSYSIRDSLLNTGELVHILTFSSKAKKNCRIIGGGYMIVNRAYVPIRVMLSDAILFLGRKQHSIPSIISPYHLSIDYELSDGSIYVSRVALSVKWKLPEDSDDYCWSIERNPIANPFRYKIETETELLFGTPGPVPEIADVLRSHPVLQNFSYYTDTVNMAGWHSRLDPLLDVWMRDLSSGDDSIKNQTLNICKRYKQVLENASGEDYERLFQEIQRVQSALHY